MTDSTENKRNDRDGFVQENDPLQELSRLFGFEGSVADERVAAEVMQSGAIYDAGRQEPELSTHSGDLAGELERELMAGFDDEFSDFSVDENYNEPVAEVVTTPTSHSQWQDPSVEDDFFASLESELNYSLDDVSDANHDEVPVEPAPDHARAEPVFSSSPVAQAPLSLEDELAFLLQGEEPESNHGSDFATATNAGSEFILPDAQQTSYQEEQYYYETPVPNFVADKPLESAEPEAEYVAEPVDDELYAVPEINHAPHADRPYHEEQSSPEHTVQQDYSSHSAQLSSDNYYSRQNFSQFTSVGSETSTEIPAGDEYTLNEELISDAEEPLYSANEQYLDVEDNYSETSEWSDQQNNVENTTGLGGFADIFRATSQEPFTPETESVVDTGDSLSATEQSEGYEADWYGESVEDSSYQVELPELSDELTASLELAGQESALVAYSAVAPEQEPESEHVSEPKQEQEFFGLEDFDFSLEDEVEQSIEQPEPAQNTEQSGVRSFVPAPEVETIAVADHKVEPTQALDLPEINFENSEPADGLSGFEAEFAEIFSSVVVDTAVNTGEQSAESALSEADKAFETILQNNSADYELSGSQDDSGNTAALAAGIAASAAVAVATNRHAASQQPSRQDTASSDFAELSDWPQSRNESRDNAANPDDYYNHWASQGTQSSDFDDYNLANELARDIDSDEAGDEYQKNSKKKYLLASVAGLALLVVAGGYYVFGSGGVGGEPVVIRADTQPTKVQPENPGGDTVPNQDKAVYDQVAGMQPVKPQQENLIDTGEKPVDVNLLHGDDEPTEERILPMDEEDLAGQIPVAQAEPLIKPRAVKTMIVRADGTIVENTSAPVIAQPKIGSVVNADGTNEPTERLSADAPAASAQSAAAPRVVQTQSFTAQGQDVVAVETPQTSEATPQITAPVIPSRPVQQQVAAVDTTQTTTQAQAPVAAVPAGTLPAGGYYIQVASQPSAELAQKNYATLMQRYSNVIGGRGVDIKKADIAGKGTFYRVRIPAGTKSEAVTLCEQFRAAGGSCFIAQ